MYREKRVPIFKRNLGEAGNGTKNSLVVKKIMAVWSFENIEVFESLVARLVPVTNSSCHTPSLRYFIWGALDCTSAKSTTVSPISFHTFTSF